MRKIAVAISKGGVGKTTTAVSLAAGLAAAGHRVLLIDADTQGQVAKALGVQPAAGLAELAVGEAGPDQALVEARDRLWLLAGGRALAGLKRLITRQDFGGERMVADALAPLDGRYDYTIVDTSPGWDALTVGVLFYVREVLAPVSLEVMTLQSLMEFARSLVGIQRYHPEVSLKYVLPTFLDRRVKKSDEILSQLEGRYGPVLCAPIRYSVRLSEAPGYGQTIYEYAPRSPGAQDYHKLVGRIARDDRP